MEGLSETDYCPFVHLGKLDMSHDIFHPIPMAVLLLVLCCTAGAQSNINEQASTPLTSSSANKPRKNADKNDSSERVRRERQALAISLLLSLAHDARTFPDQTLRARIQARVADALWETDVEQGRGLFRRAWDAAEIADKEAGLRAGNAVYSVPASCRQEVLQLASKRDRMLGEEFLRKLSEQKERDATAVPKGAKFGPLYTPDEATRQRLNLAGQLLWSGDIERALQFADPVLTFVSIEIVDFLSSLREKNPSLADRRYLGLLARAHANLQSDIDTVSILSSYLFAPHIYVTSLGRLVPSSQPTRMIPGNVEPQLTLAFFQMATEILRRELSAGQNQDTMGADEKYPVINNLLSLFESHSAKEGAEMLRVRLTILTSLVSEAGRGRDEEWRARWLSPSSKAGNIEQTLLDQIDRAKTSSQRDQIYLQLALVTSEKGDARARDFADRIEETELRKQARSYINADLAIRAIERKEVESAIDFGRPGELTHIQRLWVLTQASKLLSKTDRERSLTVLDDAAAEARRINASDPDRPRAQMAVANVLITIDRDRVWDAAFDAVKAANSADGFTGEDGKLTVSLVTKHRSSLRNKTEPDFDVAGIFALLAKDDYVRAVELARAFERAAPRASAVIAIASSMMVHKKPVQTKNERTELD